MKLCGVEGLAAGSVELGLKNWKGSTAQWANMDWNGRGSISSVLIM